MSSLLDRSLVAHCADIPFVVPCPTSSHLHAARAPSEASRRPRGRTLPRSCRRPYSDEDCPVSVLASNLCISYDPLPCPFGFPSSSSMCQDVFGALDSLHGQYELTSACLRRSDAAVGAGCLPSPRRAPLCAGPVYAQVSSQRSGQLEEERGRGSAVAVFPRKPFAALRLVLLFPRCGRLPFASLRSARCGQVVVRTL